MASALQCMTTLNIKHSRLHIVFKPDQKINQQKREYEMKIEEMCDAVTMTLKKRLLHYIFIYTFPQSSSTSTAI